MAKKEKTKKYIAFIGKRGEKWYEESAVLKAKNIKSARNKLLKKIPFSKTIKKMKQYKPKRVKRK